LCGNTKEVLAELKPIGTDADGVFDVDLGLLVFFFGVLVDVGVPVLGLFVGVVVVGAGLLDVNS
jgi:hypothetical protein